MLFINSGGEKVEKKKVIVSISVVPGREIFLQFTPFKKAIEEIENSPANAEIWVDIKGRTSIPMQGDDLEERIQSLKKYFKDLLEENRISSVTPVEEILKTIQS